MNPLTMLIIPLIFILTVFLGYFLLSFLQKKHVGQRVREDGPKTHYKKSGTPTFGGLMFLVPLLLLGFGIAISMRSLSGLLLILLIFFMSLIGFLDDYIKVKINKDGLSPWQKTLPMLLFCLLFVYYYLYMYRSGPVIIVPFSAEVIPVQGGWKILYGIFLLILMYFTINAVNLTDGVDGLLSALSLPVFASLSILAALSAQEHETFVLQSLSLAMVGGLLGFLVYNRHPARIFMGDTGSLAIGALFASTIILLGLPWLLFLPGIIYLLEALSVVLQVAYFKMTKGKRIFRMSPIHHHFELGGWSERKVLAVFSLIALCGSLLGLLALAPWFRR